MRSNGASGAAIAVGCAAIIAIVVALAALGALIFMWAWNIFVPAAFGGPTIDYWTAFAGTILLSIVGSAFRTIATK